MLYLGSTYVRLRRAEIWDLVPYSRVNTPYCTSSYAQDKRNITYVSDCHYDGNPQPFSKTTTVLISHIIDLLDFFWASSTVTAFILARGGELCLVTGHNWWIFAFYFLPLCQWRIRIHPFYPWWTFGLFLVLHQNHWYFIFECLVDVVCSFYTLSENAATNFLGYIFSGHIPVFLLGI